MRKITLIAALCCAYSVGALAGDVVQSKDPYVEYQKQLEEKQKAATAGWHFYNEEEESNEDEPKEETPAPAPAPAPAQPQQTQITAEWLNKNIPVLLNAAVNNPTQENLKNYWLAIRLSKDMASRFADNTKEFFATHPEYSEGKRRPESNYALTSYRTEVAKNKTDVVKAIFQRAGIWFFYASTCQYCAQEAPILKSMEELYGVNILAISMDGRPMPDGSFPDFVSDPSGDIYRRLMVQTTPTIYLVTNDGQQFHMLAAGIVAMDELLEALIMTAHQSKLISEDEYQSTLEVKQQLVVDHQAGPLTIDTERMKTDPQYLSQVLESKLNEFPTYGTQPFNGGINAGQ